MKYCSCPPSADISCRRAPPKVTLSGHGGAGVADVGAGKGVKGGNFNQKLALLTFSRGTCSHLRCLYFNPPLLPPPHIPLNFRSAVLKSWVPAALHTFLTFHKWTSFLSDHFSVLAYLNSRSPSGDKTFIDDVSGVHWSACQGKGSLSSLHNGFTGFTKHLI